MSSRKRVETEPECPSLPGISDSEVVRWEGVLGGHHDWSEVRVSGECPTGRLAG